MPIINKAFSNIDAKDFKKCILIFCVAVFAIYGKSIMNDYSMDDEYVVKNNVQIQKGVSAIPEILTTTYVNEGKQKYEYRPVVKITYAIEYQLFGENVHINHLVNIVLYLILILLLFTILLKLFPDHHYFFSFAITLLFLVHPLHSEVVMSLKNRDGILSFLFSLISLNLCLKYIDRNKLIYLVLAAFMLLLGVLSKKDALPFYFIIPITLWFFREISIKKSVAIFAVLTAFVFVFIFAENNVVTDEGRVMLEWENPLFIGSTWIDRIPQAFYCIYFYIKMFLIPYPLIAYYGFAQVPVVGWDHPVVWIMIIMLFTGLYFVIKRIQTRSVWIYAILYFFLSISLFVNIVEPVVGIVAERFAFIPSLGLCILAICLLFHYLRIPYKQTKARPGSFNNTVWLIFGFIFLVFSVQVISRNNAWKDSYTLYKTDAEHATESAHTHTLLSVAAINKVRENPRLSKREKSNLINEAEKHYLESLRIFPNYISSLNNLGVVYNSYMNKPETAIPYLQKAIQLDSNYVEAYFNLASSLFLLKKYKEAEYYYLKTISLNPHFVASYQPLSNLYTNTKEYDKLVEVNQRAIDNGVRSDIMYINIGNLHFMNGDTLKALPYLEKAISINALNPGVNAFLYKYYQSKGDIKKSEFYHSLMK